MAWDGFEPGKQVVCVRDDDWYDHELGGQYTGPHPVRDGVYTIEQIGLFSNGAVCLVLFEFTEMGSTARRAWLKELFRPVKPTSIEIFRVLLVNPPKELIRA